jgi:phage baseplate assembly protein W
MANDDRFGTDLRLLPNLEQENDRFPGSDLFTTETDEGVDLLAINGRHNLQQALLLRFLTPRGALAHLGHPDYGSTLHELIGERNSETNRNRAKLAVLEALAQEPRVASVLAVTVTTNRQRSPTRVDISVQLLAIGEDDPLTVTVPVALA